MLNFFKKRCFLCVFLFAVDKSTRKMLRSILTKRWNGIVQIKRVKSRYLDVSACKHHLSCIHCANNNNNMHEINVFLKRWRTVSIRKKYWNHALVGTCAIQCFMYICFSLNFNNVSNEQLKHRNEGANETHSNFIWFRCSYGRWTSMDCIFRLWMNIREHAYTTPTHQLQYLL